MCWNFDLFKWVSKILYSAALFHIFKIMWYTSEGLENNFECTENDSRFFYIISVKMFLLFKKKIPI